MKLYLYTLNDTYYEYISKYDSKVMFKKENCQARPFVGVVFFVDNISYFAPLSSPKPKHITMHESTTFVKIKNGEYGIINLNNMIPVPNECLHKLDMPESSHNNYSKLLYNQMQWCNIKNNKDLIMKKAARLYKSVSKNFAPPNLLKICCDFKLLEEKCKQFENSQPVIYNAHPQPQPVDVEDDEMEL